MPTPFLPLLKPGNKVTSITSAGVWASRMSAELERVSKGLDVTTADTKFSEVDSIPDMWARPLLFEMALYDKDYDNDDDTGHPMHGHILGEWRGLLAMLALKERLDFPLTTEQIEIPRVNDTKAPAFLRTLRKLLPENTLAADTPWTKLHLILFNGKPIGVTSPTTLVCTSVNYVGNIRDVLWYNGKCLRDPISHLNQEEKAAVAGWLQKVYKHIDPGSNPTINSNLSATVRELINDFITDLGGAPQEETDFATIGLGLTQGIFQCMDKPIAAKEYFTEKLFVIKQENAFNGTLQSQVRGTRNPFENPNGEPVTPILPIKDNLLTDLSGQSLNDRITFEHTDDGIKVNLRIPSSDTDGQNEGRETSREYKYAKKSGSDRLRKNWEIVEIPTVPVLEIWPNFTTENWKAYYTYFNKASQDTFHAKPFLPADEGDDAPELSQESTGDDENEITKTSYFPEAILCQYKTPKSSGYEDAGVLLIPTPESPITGGSTWTVGIDFGTTSTAAYRNDGHADPRSIELKKRLIQVTDSDDTDRLNLYDYFFSPKSQQTPFFSLFHIWRNNQGIRQGLKPMLDGHIYFLSDYQKFNDESTIGRIFSDLKWSTEPGDQDRAQLFLEQLCLQCAAEAVNAGAESIRWRFSFPMAFSDADKSDFQTIWQEVTDACSEVTGLKNENEGATSEPESIVIAKYFANPKFPGTFAPGAICIDIGGATSDISIWRNNELYSQTSLRFAGRDIFLNLLTENPGFLQHFGVEKDVTDGLTPQSSSETRRYAQIDALLESEYETWATPFSRKKRTSPVNEFHQLIAIGIAGLLYYVGLLLKYLIENKQFTSDYICIYIGGKGSRTLEWFGGNELDMRLLKQVFLDASGFNSNHSFRVEITQHPKEEAAFGLVSDKMKLEWKENDHQDLILAGESFRIREENFEWTKSLTPELFEEDLESAYNLEQLQKFVESFNKYVGPERDKVLRTPLEMTGSDSTDNRSLRAALEDKFKEIQNQNKEDRRPEPLFILALKELLDKKIGKWKEKTKKE